MQKDRRSISVFAVLTTTNLSYRFSISETSATTLCGTTGMEYMVLISNSELCIIWYIIWLVCDSIFGLQIPLTSTKKYSSKAKPPIFQSFPTFSRWYLQPFHIWSNICTLWTTWSFFFRCQKTFTILRHCAPENKTCWIRGQNFLKIYPPFWLLMKNLMQLGSRTNASLRNPCSSHLHSVKLTYIAPRKMVVRKSSCGSFQLRCAAPTP